MWGRGTWEPRRKADRVPIDLETFDPAEYGCSVAPGGGLRLGGELTGRAYWRPPPLAARLIREITGTKARHPPAMPALIEGSIAVEAVRRQLTDLAPLVWRAVRHREDHPKVPRGKLGWRDKTTREIVGAINVWKVRAPDVTLHALAASRWDSLYEWSGSRPRKPVAVLGRANGLDLERARALQRVAHARVLPKTPSERALVELGAMILAGLRKAKPVTLDAAIGMIEVHRGRADELRAEAEAEAADQLAELTQARDRGEWIWTCRTPSA